MITKKIGLLLFFMAMNTSVLFGHFFKIDSMKKDHQSVLLISDYHDSSSPDFEVTNAQQRQEVVDFASRHNTAVIVEDSLIAGDDKIISSSSVDELPTLFTKQELDQTPVDKPLDGLYSLCTLSGIDVVNVESRFTYQRKLQTYHTFFQNKKKQILSEYLDGEALQAYYKKKIEWLENEIEKPLSSIFSALSSSEQRLAEFLRNASKNPIPAVHDVYRTVFPDWDETIAYENKLAIIFTVYGATFLDIDIIHTLSSFKDKQTVVICAGFHHINAIKKILIDFGYLQTISVGEDVNVVDNKDYQEPTALNLAGAFEQLSTISLAQASRHVPFSHIFATIAQLIKSLV